MSDNELIERNKINAVDVFTGNGLDPILDQIKEAVEGHTPDISTAKGRDEIASLAYKVSRSKTFLDDQGKSLVAEWKKKAAKVDAERKRMRDTLDELRDRARKPLTEYEDKEKARVATHEANIEEIVGGGRRALEEWDTMPLDVMRDRLGEIEAEKMGDHWEEFAGRAAEAKDQAITDLKTAIQKRETLDADRADAERLRKEAEERDAKAREEHLRKEVEESTRKRIADEQAAREADERKRAADKDHRRAINRAAVADLCDIGLSEADAKKVITAIAKGEVPNVTISY